VRGHGDRRSKHLRARLATDIAGFVLAAWLVARELLFKRVKLSSA
jgi:hypothetical protein